MVPEAGERCRADTAPSITPALVMGWREGGAPTPPRVFHRGITILSPTPPSPLRYETRAIRELSTQVARAASRGVRAKQKKRLYIAACAQRSGVTSARHTLERVCDAECTRTRVSSHEWYRAPLAAALKTQFILHTVLYMLQYLTFLTYFRLCIIHAARRAGVVRDVASGRSETWDEMRVSHDRAGHAHGTRSRRDECGRLTTPTAGLRGGMAHGSWLMAHGSWGSRCSYRDRCSYSGRCRLAAAEDCADSAEGGTYPCASISK